MKPPFSYYGGKQKLAPKILPLLPPHRVYVEPFAGGATILFRKPRPVVQRQSDYLEVINDTNEWIVNFYRVLRDPEKSGLLIDMIHKTPYSRGDFFLARAILKEQRGDAVERAWAWFVAIQQAFGKTFGTGWGYARKQNQAYSYRNAVDRLADFPLRLRLVHIEHDDALRVIQRWDSPDTLFYCDPPYPGTDQGHYRGYTQADFENLCDTLSQIRGRFLLSCYDNPAANARGWERFDFPTHCSMRKGTKSPQIESVWRNAG